MPKRAWDEVDISRIKTAEKVSLAKALVMKQRCAGDWRQCCTHKDPETKHSCGSEFVLVEEHPKLRLCPIHLRKLSGEGGI